MPEVTFSNLFEHWPWVARLIATRLEELAGIEARASTDGLKESARAERREILLAVQALEFSRPARR